MNTIYHVITESYEDKVSNENEDWSNYLSQSNAMIKKKHFEYKICSLLCLEVRVFLCIVGYTDSKVTRYSTT